MFAAHDPGFDSEGFLRIGLGFFDTAQRRTGEGIRLHCCQSQLVFQAERCFSEGDELGSYFVSLLIPMKVK